MDTPATTSATPPTPTPSSPRTVLHLVPVEFVEAAWSGPVEELIGEAVDRGGLYAPEDIKRLLEQGLMRLWVAGSRERGAEALAVTEILQYPKARAFNVIICTGHDRGRWFSHLKTMEAWAKEQGCDVSRALTRKGWAKELADYKLTHYAWEKQL